jgi:hypothetical protein
MKPLPPVRQHEREHGQREHAELLEQRGGEAALG